MGGTYHNGNDENGGCQDSGRKICIMQFNGTLKHNRWTESFVIKISGVRIVHNKFAGTNDRLHHELICGKAGKKSPEKVR